MKNTLYCYLRVVNKEMAAVDILKKQIQGDRKYVFCAQPCFSISHWDWKDLSFLLAP